MAYNPNPFLAGNSESIREDLTGIIAIMTPADAPLWSVLGARDCHDIQFDNLVDEFDTPVSVATAAPGAEASFPTQSWPVRLVNFTNIVEEAFSVSDTSRAVLEAGFDDAYRYAAYKTAIKVVKQAEYNSHFGQVGTTAPAASAAAQTHGVVSWILWTGMGRAAASADVDIAGAAVPLAYCSTIVDPGNSSIGSFSRDMLVTQLLNPVWGRGMTIDQTMLFCGGIVKTQMSTFGHVYSGVSTAATEQVNTRNIGAGAKRIIDTIDFYESDFGTIAFNLDRYMNGTHTETYAAVGAFSTTATAITLDIDHSLFIIEPRMWEHRILRGLSHNPLAKTGDASNGQVIMEYGVGCRTPLAGGAIYNLSAA